MSLIQMSVSGGIMIFAVAVVRFLAINRLPKKLFLLLWGVILLRLLIPFSVPSVLSVYTVISRSAAMQEIPEENPVADLFLPEAEPLVTGKFSAKGELPEGGESSVTEALPAAEGMPAAEGQIRMNAGMAAQTQNPAHFSGLWSVVWIAGAVVCGIFFAVSYIRCYLEFRTSLPVRNEFTDRWLKEHRRKRSIEIRESDRILTPLTYGILHPVILMPKKTDWKDRQQLQYILQHEYKHICRLDMIWKLAAAIALCIHWFNPAVWVMYFLFNRDVEISCDESVIRQFGEASRAAYARTLIAMKEKQSGLMPFYSNFSKNVMEERITAIMKTKKVTVWAIVISALVLIAIVVLFATSAAKEPDAIIPEKLFPSEQNLPFPDLNFAVSAAYEGESLVISSDGTAVNTIPLVSDTWEIFLYMENESSGYLLCCGSPGLGQMTKLLYATDDRWRTYSEKDISLQIDGYPTSISVSPGGDIYIGTQMRGNGYMFASGDEGEQWNPIRTDNGHDREDGYYRWGYAPFFDRENQRVYVILEYDGCYYLYRSDEEMKEWENAGMFSIGDLYMIEKYRISGQYLYMEDSGGNSYQFDFR